MRFHYHFGLHTNLTPQEEFCELEHFANMYAPHIKNVMRLSGLFQERLTQTENEALMALARMGPELQRETMRQTLGLTSAPNSHYHPTLFSPPRPSNKTPYYLCGIGMVVALCALAAGPAGLAIALGCLGTFLFLAGLLILGKNRLGSSNDNELRLPSATPC